VETALVISIIGKIIRIIIFYRVRKKEGHEVDFTDRAYQVKLPMHARNTAITSVKTNVKNTELDAQPSVIHTQLKVSYHWGQCHFGRSYTDLSRYHISK